jgi:hypothetical protein
MLRGQDREAVAANYKKAADAYRRAGDTNLANAILSEMQSLIASAAPTAPPQASAPSPTPPIAPPVTSRSQNPTAPPGPQAALPSEQPSAAPQDDAGSCPPAAPQDGWQDASYCAAASQSCWERGSALYGYSCYPPPQAADNAGNVVCPPELKGSFNGSCHPTSSPITFDQLNMQALAACPADMVLRPRRDCMANAKLGYLLANDPNVAAQCAGIVDYDQRGICADAVYLYGPNAPWKGDLRAALRASINGTAATLPAWVMRLTPRPAQAWDHLPTNPCPPGQAVQPIPAREGGNGAWSCRPLVDLVQLADKPDAQPPTASGDTQETADQVETKMQDVAALIASVTAPRVGARLRPNDRSTCLAVTYRAVLAMMKGGRPPVPPMCQAVVTAARREFASYADHELYTGSRGLDRLLAVLDVYYQRAGDIFGGDLGAPRPGMSGLVPSAEDRRQADCIVAGGTLEDCAKGAK